MSESPIKAIWGMEPMREREYPQCYIIGHPAMSGTPVVTAIKRRDDYFGDHSISWYDIWSGEMLVASMSARAVAEIHYQGDET